MPSVDDLFKKPYLPSNKRKLDVNQDPNKVYKAAKLSIHEDIRSSGQNAAEDQDEEGPTLPAEQALDDEEGRFFGGGVSGQTTDVLDFIDQRDRDETADKIDSVYLRKLALNFEKRISKNAEMRVKHEGSPQNYMASEANLDAEIKGLSTLSEHPELYSEFVELGCVASLVSLLSHENTDIAIDAIEIINELTDEDVEAEQAQWDMLADALIEADLLNLLHDNILRMDESNETDREGIYHILGVLENLASKSSLLDLIGSKTDFLRWLLTRIQFKEAKLSQNSQYAAEILTILLQASKPNRRKVISIDGIDIFLQLLSSYRKRDPAKGTEEEEYVENMFDGITCCVDENEGKARFLEAEGVELCLLMIKAGNMSKDRAIRLLDHALEGPGGEQCCERFVEAAGLKPLFGILAKRHDPGSTPHLISILSSLLRVLPSASPHRIRLLAKFVEREYQAVTRLCGLYANYAARLTVVDRTIEREKKQQLQGQTEGDNENVNLREAEYFSRRMDAGLYTLQTCCVVLAWIVAEDEGARWKVEALLKEQNKSLIDLKIVLEEQVSSAESEGNQGGDEDQEGKAVLEALIDAIG